MTAHDVGRPCLYLVIAGGRGGIIAVTYQAATSRTNHSAMGKYAKHDGYMGN